MTPGQATTHIFMSRAILTAWQAVLPDNGSGHDAARAEAEIETLRLIAVQHPAMADEAGSMAVAWRGILLALRSR